MGNYSEFQRLLDKHIDETSSLDRENILTDSDRKVLLSIVRNTLKTYLQTSEIPEVVSDQPALLELRATFVTLRTKDNNDLRGCKGEIFPRQSLVEAVQNTAISSATNDPRFAQVTADELADLKIEISVLKPIKPIEPEDVIIGRHGLVIVKGNNSGLLLPHVPIFYNLDKDTFLKELCIKANLNEDAWKDKDSQLYGFEAEVFEESI
jgi:AmmeMemoRadiSam system protein A